MLTIFVRDCDMNKLAKIQKLGSLFMRNSTYCPFSFVGKLCCIKFRQNCSNSATCFWREKFNVSLGLLLSLFTRSPGHFWREKFVVSRLTGPYYEMVSFCKIQKIQLLGSLSLMTRWHSFCKFILTWSN